MLSMLLWGSTVLTADAAVETYFVDSREFQEAVLRDTIGVLTISVPEEEHETHAAGDATHAAGVLLTYRLETDGRFTPAGHISVRTLKGVNGWHYSSTFLFRVPIVRSESDYLEIVADVRADSRVWISIDGVRRFWSSPSDPRRAFITWLRADQPRIACGEGDVYPPAFDVFYLIGGQNRRLYDTPSMSGKIRILAAGSPLLDGIVFITAHQAGFGRVEVLKDVSSTPRFIGWIRLRDDQGRLTVWPISYDLC
jgi:hypothetical protein